MPSTLKQAHRSYGVTGSSVDGVLLDSDAFSCLIFAAVALALFPRKRFRMSSLKGHEKGVYAGFKKEKKGVYHATLTLECCKTERPALLRQLVEVMPHAFRRKFPIFHDTIRVQDAVFESCQERLAVVGHRVCVCGFLERSDYTTHRAKPALNSPSHASCPMFRVSDRNCDQHAHRLSFPLPESNVPMSAYSLVIPLVRAT